MIEVSLITAFTAGLLSFFAPCILPLVPPYFAWLLGISEQEVKTSKLRLKVLGHGFLLIVGFSTIFIILGASASWLGQVIAPYRLWAQRLGGLIIIIFGLEFTGLLKIFKNCRDNLVKKIFTKFNRQTGSLIIGAAFAFAWVACFSPVLGSILVLSSFQGTLSQGILLLSFYSFGLAVPFLICSLFLGLAMEKFKILTKISKWLNLFSGLILLLIGFLLISDNFYKIVMWLDKVL